MSVIVNSPAVTPAPVFPYAHSALSLFQSERRLDPHAFLGEEDAGGVEWVPLPCPIAATGYVPALCLAGEVKSDPQRIDRPPVTVYAKWFEAGAVRTLMPGCASLVDAVTRALEDKLQTAIDEEIAADLSSATVLGSEDSVLCAVAAAVDTLAPGIGVITLPPDAVAVLTATDYFRCSEETLQDLYGNLYVTNASSVPGRVYAESQPAYEIWVTEPEFIDESDRRLQSPDSVTAATNDEVVRGSRGFILLHSFCSVAAVDYVCSAA